MSYPETYYSRSLAAPKVRPKLDGVAECDTVVVGGGLAGLTTALQLARAGQRVIVLEAQSVGFGASGRNGGFVSPGYATDIDDIARKAGKEAARRLYRLSIEGVEFVRQTIRELDITSAFPQSGIMSVLRYDGGTALKDYARTLASEFRYDLEYLEREQVRAILHSERYYQGLRDPNAFHMHPLNYLRAIAAAIEDLGGTIYEESQVIEAKLVGAEKVARVAGGEVRARQTVFATGGYTGSVIAPLKRAFLPIATYVMLTEEAPELIVAAITTTDAIGDNRRAGDYYRVIDGGKRLLWGGRITTRAASPAAVARALRREMIGTYPQLAALKTELAWSGLMSYARHLMPQIGQLAPGTWYLTAFGGHGLNTTAIAGKLVAEAIVGESERYRMFDPFDLSWAGGLAGLAAAQLTYWKLQAQDRWRERSR